MRKVAQWVVKFRVPLLIVIIIITLFFAYQIKNIKINSDWSTYLKKDDPIIELFHYVGEKFNGNVTAAIAIETKNVFSYEVLKDIADMTEKLKSIQGINSVTSLADIIDIRSVEGILEVRKLIDTESIPENKEKLDSLKQYVLSRDMYNGRIVSSDSKVTIIICVINPGTDEEKLSGEIKKICDDYKNKYKIYYAGIPMQMLELSEIVKKDLIRLVPFAIIVLILMLYLNFGDFKSVSLPLISVVISTVWCIGFMVLVGVEFSIISNVLPVVLITVGSAYGVHLVAHFRELKKEIRDREKLVIETVTHVGIPIFLAALTTLIGFLSFIGSYVTIVTEFGIFSAIGVFIALVISIVFIPILLYYMSRKKFIEKSLFDKPLEKFLLQIKALVLRHNKWIVAFALAIIIISIIGLPLLRRDSNIMKYFKENTDIRIAERVMKKYFGGSYTIQVLVRGDMKHPAVLKKMIEVEKYLNSIENVSKAQSAADYICEMNRVMNGHYTIPETKQGVSNLYFFIENEPIISQMVTSDFKEGLIQARIYTLDTKKIIQLVDSVDKYINSEINSRLTYVEKAHILKNSPIDSFITKKIVENIIFDIKKCYPHKSIDFDGVYKNIITAGSKENFPFSSYLKKRLISRLNDFFSYESAIIIDSDNLIRALTDELTEIISNGSPPLQIVVENKFKEHKLYEQFSKEEIDATVEAILDIWDEFYKNAKVDYIANVLISNYDLGRNNTELFQDIRDDLWILNEDHFIIPYSLSQKFNIKGEEINIDMSQTGTPSIFKRLDESIVKSQIISLAIAIALVYLLLVIQLKSFIGGLYALTPIVITILFNFALMAFFDVPLDMVTVIIASIAIGIGIDYSIHFINRFKMEFDEHGSIEKVLESTLLTTGKAIMINAISIIAGFLILVFGELIPVQRFGWLISTTMVISVLGAITVLPSLVISTRSKFIGDFSSMKIFNMNSFKIGGKK